jgi:trigger factor
VRVQIPLSPFVPIYFNKENILKIETQTREDHQVTVNVELDNEKMEGARRKAARKIAQRIKISGFRPGKAPYEVVVRTAGEATITEEAVELLVDEIYPQVLEEAGIKPAAPGSLEEITNVDPPKFKFLIPLLPSVELGDYRSIRSPYDWQPPNEDKVDESIEELRRMYSKTENVDRPIQVGDFALTDVKGVNAKSEPEDKPLIEKPGNPVFIRPDEKLDEWPFKGFSKKLVGIKADDTRTFSHKYPKDFEDENLKGLTVNFEVRVKTIRGMILPELTDEFAKKVGNFENVRALREAVRTNLDNQSKAEFDDKYFDKLIDEIKAQATIKYPPQVLAHESEHVLEDLKNRLSQQNLEMDVYLKMRGLDYDKFIQEEVTPVAIRRLERSLIIDQIAVNEKIEVSEEKLNSAFQQTWSELQVDENFQKAVKKKPSQKMMESIAMESASRAMMQQTLDRMKLIAIGEAPELQTESDKTKSPAKKRSKKQAEPQPDQAEDVISKTE